MACIQHGRNQYFYRQVRGRFFFPLATHRQQTQIVRTSSRYKTAAIVRPFNACLYASSTCCYLGQHSPKITDALRCSVTRH